jgi:hypothetical protein
MALKPQAACPAALGASLHAHAATCAVLLQAYSPKGMFPGFRELLQAAVAHARLLRSFWKLLQPGVHAGGVEVPALRAAVMGAFAMVAAAPAKAPVAEGATAVAGMPAVMHVMKQVDSCAPHMSSSLDVWAEMLLHNIWEAAVRGLLSPGELFDPFPRGRGLPAVTDAASTPMHVVLGAACTPAVASALHEHLEALLDMLAPHRQAEAAGEDKSTRLRLSHAALASALDALQSSGGDTHGKAGLKGAPAHACAAAQGCMHARLRVHVRSTCALALLPLRLCTVSHVCALATGCMLCNTLRALGVARQPLPWVLPSQAQPSALCMHCLHVLRAACPQLACAAGP